MTQRIAEADGGRVWMEWDGDFNQYLLRHPRWDGYAYYHDIMYGWCIYILGSLKQMELTEADAVCLLWSKV
jgi:hypothetical protein